MGFTRQGDIRLVLDVPYSDKHLALPLSEAWGLTLNVSIERLRRPTG